MPKNKEKHFTFICPSCDNEQSTVIDWRGISVADMFDFKTKEFKQVNKTDESDHEFWSCPECSTEIKDKKLIKKINKIVLNL